MLEEIGTATAILDRADGSAPADRDDACPDRDLAEETADEARLDEMLLERRVDLLQAALGATGRRL